MLCWKCGKEVTEDFLFCPTCGKAQLSPEEANTLGLAHLLSQLLSRRVSVADRNKSEQFVRQICGQDWKLQEEQGKLLCVLENHFHVDLTSPTPEPPPPKPSLRVLLPFHQLTWMSCASGTKTVHFSKSQSWQNSWDLNIRRFGES
ncbi:MAG: zinc-ribbon domain-containing protein [Patescibacteria group bacterium]|jgi:hypothetical protein